MARTINKLTALAVWPATLGTYVYPVMGALPVQAVDVGLVLQAIEPTWTTKPETAGRVRGRIESVLDWAAARGYRQGGNPARWRGHLQNLLPQKAKVRRVAHHAALPYVEIAAFMAVLRQQEGVAARALEFTILTAARTGEVIGARWEEINLSERLWTIAAERMKAGKEHRVPLSAPALAVLKDLAKVRESNFVFPGGRHGRPISNMAMLKLLDEAMEDGGCCFHPEQRVDCRAGREDAFPRPKPNGPMTVPAADLSPGRGTERHAPNAASRRANWVPAKGLLQGRAREP